MNNNNILKKIDTGSFFMSRRTVEQNLKYKQIIVYFVLRNQNAIFLYKRIPASSEKRLLYKYSVGLGGHINPCRAKNLDELLSFNLNRELTEEVYFAGYHSYRFLGMVNDEKTEVGKFHLGLVFLVSCSTREIEVKEKNKIVGKMVDLIQLANYRGLLESWSEIILPEVTKEFLR